MRKLIITFSRVSVPDDDFVFRVVLAGYLGGLGELAGGLDDLAGAQQGGRLGRRSQRRGHRAARARPLHRRHQQGLRIRHSVILLLYDHDLSDNLLQMFSASVKTQP